jgi:A/G-specific adenine glycosylase
VPFVPTAFAVALVEWFRASQREMPWRRAENISDPYRILVSEMMLQQTTVAAVTPFFERFVARFPTLATLASADESDVLALWSGLGYYARARNLQKAAKSVVENHGGTFPRDFDAILALPGVGRYTAGAVASIAFEQRQPIVDANVARVFARVLPVDGDLKTAANQAKLWAAAQQVVEVENVPPREVNPALMELGALICTPKNPRCEVCPVAEFCAAKAQGRQNQLPLGAPPKTFTPLFDACAWASDGEGRFLLRRRPDENKLWWRGMWELPRTTRQGEESATAALQRLGSELGVTWQPGEKVLTLKHGVTRFAIELECWQVEAPRVSTHKTLQWFTLDDALELPMPSVMKTALRKLSKGVARQLSLEMA